MLLDQLLVHTFNESKGFADLFTVRILDLAITIEAQNLYSQETSCV